MGLRLAKRAVNLTSDIQGQWSAIQGAFALHHVGHAHARTQFDGNPIDPAGLGVIRREARSEAH
jgi:enoyl-CoA hydratase